MTVGVSQEFLPKSFLHQTKPFKISRPLAACAMPFCCFLAWPGWSSGRNLSGIPEYLSHFFILWTDKLNIFVGSGWSVPFAATALILLGSGPQAPDGSAGRAAALQRGLGAGRCVA